MRGILNCTSHMNPVIRKFIHGFEDQKREYRLEGAVLSSRGVRLEVKNKPHEDPHSYRLSLSFPTESSDEGYPILMLTTVFGRQSEWGGLMKRQALAFDAEVPFFERIGEWSYSSEVVDGRCCIVLTAD